MRTIPFLIFMAGVIAAYFAGVTVQPEWRVEKVTLDVQKNDAGDLYYTYKGKPRIVQPKAFVESLLHPEKFQQNLDHLVQNDIKEDVVFEEGPNGPISYYELKLAKHYGFWSLLPALLAVALCWLTKRPVPSLLGGILAGAFLLGRYDLTEDVFLPSVMSKNVAGIIILYLWLLGGLLGIWSKTGAGLAFADFMTKHFVRGPKSAKVVAWFLGIIFFQGGTISTVLVGTAVKPLADKEKVSHEELSYIVDSTASPIASQLAFNAWPGFVQAFIFVPGVAWLATESDRIAFFFKTIPFTLYAKFAIIGTLMLALDKPMFVGKKMKAAMKRARETGKLDAEGARPLSAKELETVIVPKGYKPHVIDFALPLVILLVTAVGTFVATGSPQVRWAFGLAILSAVFLALGRGMSLNDLADGIATGLKGVVYGSLILAFAITLGGLIKETGAGFYLVEQLGESIPYWSLPVILQLITIVVAFSTGTSWGTYAVAFPLAMPLAWSVANSAGLAHPEFFMMVCFAAVMDGSVYGDQCSPISDTTVLSSMCTGCDLMDHVKTQIPQATVAAGLAAVGWTIMVRFFA